MDQICINQEVLEEKGLQVGDMAEIFRQAELVYACVGPHVDGSELLFDAIQHLKLAREERTKGRSRSISTDDMLMVSALRKSGISN
jgi:hypothetical protein